MPQTNPGPLPLASLAFQTESTLSVAEFKDILIRSGLSERRPVEEEHTLSQMLTHANLVVTARDAEGRLMGVSRSLTDFTYCCYLSDLAVDASLQRQGVGKQLIAETQKALAPECLLLLLAAPKAKDYYAKVGFRPMENAWAIGGRTLPTA